MATHSIFGINFTFKMYRCGIFIAIHSSGTINEGENMKAKKSKTTVKKKAAAPKAKTKKKALKAKAAPKAKAKVKAKSKVAAKTKAAPKKKSGGFTVQELFQMKLERESAAQNPDHQHTNDIPAQDQHTPEAAKDHGSRKSGFGGSRHH